MLEYRADTLYESIEYRRYWSCWCSFYIFNIFEHSLLSNLLFSRNLRHIFNNWKRGIVFLEWGSDELVTKERRAVRHLKTRLLLHWRNIATESRKEVEMCAATSVRGCILRYPFRLWRLLHQATVLRKTLLASRGITNFRVIFFNL
jgi:hypothetical protein